MVRPAPTAASGAAADKGGSTRSSSGHKELEWSLRSLRKFDTGNQHYLTNYYDSDSDSDSETNGADTQSAYEIFKAKPAETNGGPVSSNITGNLHPATSVWAALNVPLRTGVVDGRKVVFELKSSVTKRPQTSRAERLQRVHIIRNANVSPTETRLRFWLMYYNVSKLSVIYFTAFIAMNVVLAGLLYIDQNKCCGDPEFTFADVFNFAIQSTTTIGYGSFSPDGHAANFLVAVFSYISTLMNTLFAGLLFTKFITPVVNIQFSDVMTICNVNGVPCLSFRLGAPDGTLNPLTDINVRLSCSYRIPYTDHRGEKRFFQQTEDLRLQSNRQHGLKEVWTLRHVLDESSPLFGLHFEEHPGNKIYVFTLSIDAVQDLTKSSVNVQTEYALEDIMIGHSFQSLVEIDKNRPLVVISDFSKMSDTEPYPVWYPAKAGAYAEDATKPKSYSV